MCRRVWFVPRRTKSVKDWGGRMRSNGQRISWIRGLWMGLALLLSGGLCAAQKDPGVRPGSPGAGGQLNGVTNITKAAVKEGFRRMRELQGGGGDSRSVTMASPVGSPRADCVTKT